jgi:SAM-dependent methyltransferase
MGTKLDVPMPLRRGRRRDDDGWYFAARGLLELLARSFDLPDLSNTSVLDVGCGTKFAAAILNDPVPIRRYVGVDTDAAVIEFLSSHVDDPRLSFHHFDVHNELYNQTGQPLASFGRLPIPDERFDVISLFSVFTHLAPHDYRAMLEVLRPHVAPDGALLFSLFVDEGMDAAQRAAVNQEIRRRRALGDPEIEVAIHRAAAEPEVPDFLDRIPATPLLEAVYSEGHARELIDGTGWEVEALHRPERPIIQHYFICRPI